MAGMRLGVKALIGLLFLPPVGARSTEIVLLSPGGEEHQMVLVPEGEFWMGLAGR